MKYWYLLISAISSVVIYSFLLKGGSQIESITASIIIGLISGLLVFPVAEIKRRKELGIDVFATLETDPSKVKERMLFVMQWGHSGGIVGALNEFNEIFRNYPQWHLQGWEVFQAWYKNLIDHALEHPDIYFLKMKSGGEYRKEDDPLYNPDALPWEQFDRVRDYDDSEDDFPDRRPNLKRAAKEGFMMGVGFGIAENVIEEDC